MDRLVKPDVKELEVTFKTGKKCTATFRLSNLMHTMAVAVSLTTSNRTVYSFTQPLSIIPPLSSASYLLVLSQLPGQPPFSINPEAITVKSCILPTGKAHLDDLRRLFLGPGSHIFRDAIIPISLVGNSVAEYLISNHTQIPDVSSHFNKAISGCSGSQLTTLLRSAVSSGNANMVARLIDVGGDVNCKASDGSSLISLAVKVGSFDVVNVLIGSGCLVDVSKDKVLHLAAEKNRVDLMEILWNTLKKLDANSVDSHGRTPIHVAASCGHVEAIRFFVTVGGNADVLDRKGWSPLHLAAEKGHLEAVKYLLDCSCYTKYAVNEEGKTASVIAVDQGHSKLYDLLHYGDALQRAARLDDVNGIRSSLSEGADVNQRDQNGWTPLHRAAFKGRIESVKVLLNHGAQVDVADDAGYTPLQCAVQAGRVQVAMLLIAAGARANLKGLKGVRALHFGMFQESPFCL